jgi:MGT family glycosyltransferase
MSKLAREHNLRKPSEINVLSSSAELNIVFSSRYFQPYAGSLDDSYLFIGPVIHTDRADGPWPVKRKPGQKLIYIAVGTLYQADLSFFRHCIEAFASNQYAVIISVGKAVNPAALDPIPDNVTVAQFVPQLAILDEADLFITHGGMNSINEAVLAGVPLVVVPHTIEQAVNANRIEQLRAGLYIEPTAVSAGRLRQAAQQVLGNPDFQDGTKKISQSFHDAGGVPRAVAAIHHLQQRHGLR